jgi:hypothetical protein
MIAASALALEALASTMPESSAGVATPPLARVYVKSRPSSAK